MKNQKLALAGIALCAMWCSCASAGTVGFQNFLDRDASVQPASSSSGFVIQPSRRARHASVQRAEVKGLAASRFAQMQSDFSSMGSRDGEPVRDGLVAIEMPAAPISVPAWMRGGLTRHRRARLAPVVWVPPVGQVDRLTAVTFGNCDARPYSRNPSLSAAVEARRAYFYPAMAEAACSAGVPVNLFDAMITQESRYNPVALSPKGASGLGQLMPGTARRLGVFNVWDTRENLRGSARELKSLLNQFGRFDLALAAYNAGPGRVTATGQVPRIRETMNYVANILTTMRDQFAREVFGAGTLGIPSAQARPMVRQAAYLRF